MKDKEIIKKIRSILENRTDIGYIPDLDKPITEGLLKDSMVLSREEFEKLLRKYFVIKVLPYGYYTGINKKYGEIFDCSDKKFAKRFISVEETKSITGMLDRVGYEYFVEEVDEDLQSRKEMTEKIFAELFYIASIHHSDIANILAWAKDKVKQLGIEIKEG